MIYEKSQVLQMFSSAEDRDVLYKSSKCRKAKRNELMMDVRE